MVGFASDGVIAYMKLKISVDMGMKMGRVIERLLSIYRALAQTPRPQTGSDDTHL